MLSHDKWDRSGDNGGMTIATPERYAQMLDAARRGGYAYPAINVTSTQTLNAALQGFAEAESDGIIQVSVGGAAYFSGQRVNDRVTGSLAFAAFAHEVAAKIPQHHHRPAHRPLRQTVSGRMGAPPARP